MLEELVTWTLAIELAILGVGLGLLCGHAALRRIIVPSRRSRLDRLRSQLLIALDRPSDDGSASRLLSTLSVHEQLELISGLKDILSGGQSERLRRAADTAGVLSRAETLGRSRRWRRRLRGARVITLLGGGGALGQRLLEDPRPDVRAQAAEWAATNSSPPIVDRLIEMLGDERGACRFAVTDALFRLGPLAVDRLVAQLRERSGANVEPVLRVAARRADPRMLEPALALCEDPWAPTRVRAAELLGALGGERAVVRLSELLSDPDADVRAQAARGLGRAGYSLAASALADCLEDSSFDVRREAAMALRGLGGAGTLMLRQALGRRDRYAREMARHVLDLPTGAAR